MIPFKLIPRPAGLHPVTLSCSSGPCAVPHPGKHIGGDLLYFSFLPFSLRGVRYFHPRVFHSPSTAVPPSFSFSYLPHCHNHSATVGFSNQPQLTGILSFSPSVFSFLCIHLLPFLSLPSRRASPSHLLFPLLLSLSLTTSLSVNDFSFPSHISSSLQPLFTVPRYLCSSSSPYVLFLPLSASDLSAI